MENCAPPSTSSLEPPLIILDSDEEDTSSVIFMPSPDCESNEVDSDSDSVKIVGCVSRDSQDETPVKHSFIESLPHINLASTLVSVQINPFNRHLFPQNFMNALTTFGKQSISSQKLYVLLLKAPYSWKRVKILPLDELEDAAVVVNDLIKDGFLTSDTSSESVETLLKFLTSVELKAICQKYNLEESGEREKLVKSLLEYDGSQSSQEECTIPLRNSIDEYLGVLIKLTEGPRKLFLDALLLYSLPHARQMGKDGQTTVLDVMSQVTKKVLVYPEHHVLQSVLIYPSASSFKRFQEAVQGYIALQTSITNSSYSEIITKYKETLDAFKRILSESETQRFDKQLPVCLRIYTAGSVLAETLASCLKILKNVRKFKKMVEGYQALLSQEVYLRTEHGRWYAKLATTYMKLKDMKNVVEVLTKGLSDKSLHPLYRILLSNRARKVIYQNFRSKNLKKKAFILKSMIVYMSNQPAESLTVKFIYRGRRGNLVKRYMIGSDAGGGQTFTSVEEAIIYYYQSCGYDEGVIGGDALCRSIFAVFLWDLIYTMPVENVYSSPFQNQPLDLQAGYFYLNRRTAIRKRIHDMTEVWTIQDLRDFIDIVWREKGTRSLMSWKRFGDKFSFYRLMVCIGLPLIAKICKRLAIHYPVARMGFPDVVVWNASTKRVRFFAVKRNGLTLPIAKNAWLAYLNETRNVSVVCDVILMNARRAMQTSEGSEGGHSLQQ